MNASARQFVGRPTEYNLRALNVEPKLAVRKEQLSSHQPAHTNTIISGQGISWIASPQDLENPSELAHFAQNLVRLGIKFIRADLNSLPAPTSLRNPSRFDRLHFIARVAKQFGLKVVSELQNYKDLDDLIKYCDIIELNSRTLIKNQALIELAQSKRTILLHRCASTPVYTFLKSLKRLEQYGATDIILAENALRQNDRKSAKLIDVSSIIALKRHFNYPVVVDCSLCSNDAQFASSLAVALITAGADGLIFELSASAAFAEESKALSIHELWSIIRNMRALKSTLNALTQFNAIEVGFKSS